MSLYAAPASKAAMVSDGADAEVSEFRLADLEATLRTMRPGPERDYFAGVLANRSGRTNESIELLKNALPSIRLSHPTRAAVALEALADDYNKSFRYDGAARTYDDLLMHFSNQLRGEQLQGTKDDAGVMHLLRGAPPQTISWNGPTRLKTEHSAQGWVLTDLTVNGIRQKWILDTGANLSVVSRSFAQKLGLKPLPGFGQTMSWITGIENPLQVALLPTLQMGGATLHNVVVLVMNDSDLKLGIGDQAYQINAIVGYPVFQALGAITFQHDGWFEAGNEIHDDAASTRMYMKLLGPVIECGVEGNELPFNFDTGASGTLLSIRYFERFRGDVGSWKKGKNESFGTGGIVKRTIYVQPKLHLTVGDRTSTLNQVPIFRTKMGSGIDELYGNLGQDMVAGFDSFTLDFSKMTFSLGAPLTIQSKQ
jgi:predicted aspartyl protease